MERDDPDVHVIPPKGFECEEKQKDQVWRLKAWLYGLRLSPSGWWGTMHTCLLEIGFVSSTADPCAYNLDYGAILLLLYADDISLFGSDDEKVLQVIEMLLDRFESEDLGDAKFFLVVHTPKRARRYHYFIAGNIRQDDTGNVRDG